MSYTIFVRNLQLTPAKKFDIVEKTVFYHAGGGTWTGSGLGYLLTLGDTGTSGTLRFGNPEEYFLVALGVDDRKPWADIQTDLTPGNTGLAIHPRYYNGDLQDIPKDHTQKVEKKTTGGASITVKYTDATGPKLGVEIITRYD